MIVLIIIWILTIFFYICTVISPNCLHIQSYKLLYKQMIKRRSILNLFYFRKNTSLYPRLKLISISLYISIFLAFVSIALFVIGKVNKSLENIMNYILLGDMILILLIYGGSILYLSMKEWYINKTTSSEVENEFVSLIEKEYPDFFK